MSFLQGDALPNITETTTKTQTTPGYYTDYLTNLSQAGTSALYSQVPGAGTPGVLKTGEQLIAGMDPMQIQGYKDLEDAAGAYTGTLEDAITAANAPAGGLSASRITGLMDPYTENVVKEMERLSQQNVQRQLLPTLKAGFVGSGGLGSQRYAGALGQAMADVQANLTGQQYGALSKGYSDAMKAALDELRIQNEAAKTLGTLAGQEQELGLAGAQALIKGGAEQQAFEQSKMDAPLRYAKEAADVMRSFQVPISQEDKFVGPKAGAYGLSDLSQIMAILSGLGGIRPDSREGQSVLGKIAEKIPGLLSAEGTDGFDFSKLFDVDWSSWTGNLEDVTTDTGYSDEDINYNDLLLDGSDEG